MMPDPKEVGEEISSLRKNFKESRQRAKSLKIRDTVSLHKASTMQTVEIAKQQMHHVINEYFTSVGENYVQIHSQYPSRESMEQLVVQIDKLQTQVAQCNEQISEDMSASRLSRIQDENLNSLSEEILKDVAHLEQQTQRVRKQTQRLSQDQLPSIKINKRVLEGLYLQLNEYATVMWPSEVPLKTLTSVHISHPNYFSSGGKLPVINEQHQVVGLFDVEKRVSEVVIISVLGPQDDVQYSATTVVDPKGMIYFLGGLTNLGLISDSVHYMDELKLHRLSSMQVKRGCIYVMGGCTDQNVKTKLCERYNIESKKWESIASMGIGKARAGCCTLQGSIYTFFGSDSYGNVIPSAERYAVSEDKWYSVTLSNYLPGFDITFCSAVQINNEQILIFGGMRDSLYFKDQMYFNRNMMVYSTTTECFAILDQTLPIDFLPLTNAVIHDGAVYCLGTFMKSFDKPQLFLDGGFVLQIDGQAPKVVNFTPARG